MDHTLSLVIRIASMRYHRSMDDAEFMEKSSELLRREMSAKRISHRRMARLTGISVPTIGRHYRGDTPMSLLQAYRYAEALGIDPDLLLPRLDSNQQPFGLPTGAESAPEASLAGVA